MSSSRRRRRSASTSARGLSSRRRRPTSSLHSSRRSQLPRHGQRRRSSQTGTSSRGSRPRRRRSRRRSVADAPVLRSRSWSMLTILLFLLSAPHVGGEADRPVACCCSGGRVGQAGPGESQPGTRPTGPRGRRRPRGLGRHPKYGRRIRGGSPRSPVRSPGEGGQAVHCRGESTPLISDL